MIPWTDYTSKPISLSWKRSAAADAWLCDDIAAVALAFRNLGFGRPPLVRRERSALINRLAKGALCLASDVALVSLMWLNQFAFARCFPFRCHYPLLLFREDRISGVKRIALLSATPLAQDRCESSKRARHPAFVLGRRRGAPLEAGRGLLGSPHHRERLTGGGPTQARPVPGHRRSNAQQRSVLAS